MSASPYYLTIEVPRSAIARLASHGWEDTETTSIRGLAIVRKRATPEIVGALVIDQLGTDGREGAGNGRHGSNRERQQPKENNDDEDHDEEEPRDQEPDPSRQGDDDEERAHADAA